VPADVADNALQDQAVDALARQVVSEVSPAELPLFTATAARYREDPQGTTHPKSGADDSLGFGVETAIILVAPFAIDLVKHVFARLSDKLGDAAADSLAARITHLFGGSHDSKVEDPLSPEQLALIGDTAREEAAKLALPPDRAEALADGVVAALATRT
jgi:hypothetical protein